MGKKIGKKVGLSSRSNTLEGDLIVRLFFDDILDCLLLPQEYDGSSYREGGWRSLNLYLNHGDLVAFFDLVEEFYRNNNLGNSKSLVIGCLGLRQKVGV
jgi:hypothetical protein